MRETIPVNMDHFGLISQRSELEQVFLIWDSPLKQAGKNLLLARTESIPEAPILSSTTPTLIVPTPHRPSLIFC